MPGFGQTHLRDTAILLEKHELLDSIILPLNIALKEGSQLRKIPIVNRAANRNHGLPRSKVNTLFLGDLIYQFGFWVHRKVSPKLGIYLEALGFMAYSNSSARKIRRKNPSLKLIVRAGFAGKIRKKVNNPIICDVSLVHPQHLESLIETGEFSNKMEKGLSPVERLIAQDIEESEFILANCEFVKESLVRIGVPEQKIFVAYLEPEKIFQIHANRILDSPRTRSNYILFAGTLEKRKGIEELCSLSQYLISRHPEVELHLVGNWMPSGQEFKERLSKMENVQIFSWMSWEQLVEKIYSALVFVFPTRAEGSARVIMESMYLGVPVITTLNSGSVIRHAESGIIVPSNKVESLNYAVSDLILNYDYSENLGKRGRDQVSKMILRGEYFAQLSVLLDVVFKC